AVPQLLHRHVGRQQCHRPYRANDQAAFRVLIDEIHPPLVGTAARMRRRIARRIYQFRLAFRNRAAACCKQQGKEEGKIPHVSPRSCRNWATIPTIRSWSQIFASTISASIISTGTPACSSAAAVSLVPDCERRLSGGSSMTAASIPQRSASAVIHPFIHGGRCSVSFMDATRLASASIGEPWRSRI